MRQLERVGSGGLRPGIQVHCLQGVATLFAIGDRTFQSCTTAPCRDFCKRGSGEPTRFARRTILEARDPPEVDLY